MEEEYQTPQSGGEGDERDEEKSILSQINEIVRGEERSVEDRLKEVFDELAREGIVSKLFCERKGHLSRILCLVELGRFG